MLPDICNCEQARAQSIFPFERAPRKWPLVLQLRLAEGVERLFHWIERLARAGQDAMLYEHCEPPRKRPSRFRIP